MTAQQTDAITDPQSIIAALQQRLDAALSEKATLAEELAARDAALALRNSEFGERIEQQSATIDVLKVMSASPGDPQPVFESDCPPSGGTMRCLRVGLFEFDGSMHHLREMYGFTNRMLSAHLFSRFSLNHSISTARIPTTARSWSDKSFISVIFAPILVISR